MNTPMMSALVRNVNGKEIYIKSVLQRNTTMYWLGYLYKKIH